MLAGARQSRARSERPGERALRTKGAGRGVGGGEPLAADRSAGPVLASRAGARARSLSRGGYELVADQGRGGQQAAAVAGQLQHAPARPLGHDQVTTPAAASTSRAPASTAPPPGNRPRRYQRHRQSEPAQAHRLRPRAGRCVRRGRARRASPRGQPSTGRAGAKPSAGTGPSPEPGQGRARGRGQGVAGTAAPALCVVRG